MSQMKDCIEFCRENKSGATAFAALSALFAMCTLYEYDKSGVSLGSEIVLFLGIFFGMFALLIFLTRRVDSSSSVVEVNSLRFADLKLPFIIIFICLFFNWLTNWPMAATSDSMAPVNVAMGNHGLSAWHPLFWVLFVIPFVKLGNILGDPNIGIGICTFVQVLLLAAIYSFVSVWMKRRGVPSTVYWFSIAFFALNPIVAQYAVYLSKDGLFASFFLLFSVLLFDIAFTKGEILKKREFFITFAVTTFFTASFRMNAIYATAVILIVLAIVFRKTVWKRIVPLLLVPAIVWFVYGPVCGMLGISRSPFSESAAVPLSQIGYVLQNGGDIPDEEKETLNKILPLEDWSDAYRKETVNDIKFHENFDGTYLEEHKNEFLSAWAHVGLWNPIAYFDAWFAMTEGFWNIDTPSDWIAPGAQYHYVDPVGYNPSTELQPSDGLLYSVFGVDLFHHDTGEDVAVLSNSILFYPFCNIACLVWFAAFVFGLLVASKRKCMLWTLPVVALFVLYFTVLIATPVWAEFRYVYAFHLMFPLLLGILFLHDSGKVRNAS